MAGIDKDNLKLTKDVYDAFNKGDLEVLRGCLTNNSTLKLMAMNQTLKGPNDILNYFNVYRTAFNATVNTNRVTACGDVVLSEFNGKGVHRAVFQTPMGDIQPTNRSIDLPVCHVIQWKDGKIVELHEYFDVNSLMSQLGISVSEERHAY